MSVSGISKAQTHTVLSAAFYFFCLSLPLSIAGANIGWGLIAASLILYFLTGQKISWEARYRGAEKPLWLFLAAALLASMLGVNPAYSLGFFHQDAHKLWMYILLSVGSATCIRAGKKEDMRPEACLGAAFIFSSIVGIYQVYSTINLEIGERLRAHAFVHPATYGEQMCIAFLGAFFFLLAARNSRTAKAAAAVAFFTAIGLFLSNTRGAMIACAIGLISACMLLPRLRKRLVWIVPSALICLVMMDVAREDRSVIGEFLGIQAHASHRGQMMRFHLWDAAVRIGWDNLWTGVGHNNFRSVFPQYTHLIMEDRTNSWGTAHNLYLHHFAERGLLGLSALLFFLAALWTRALQRARAAATPLNLWAFATVTAFLVMNMTEVAMQVEIVWMLVFFVWIRAESVHAATEKKSAR